MNFSIIGGGLAGCVLASLLPNSVIYEKNKLGGLCRDNRHYQEFVHILHTDNKDVWDLVNKYTDVRPHSTALKSYVNGEILPWPAKKITPKVIIEQILGYSKKMWLKKTPLEAARRIITADDGKIFHNKYEGIPNFTKLFHNLTKSVPIIYQSVKDGDIDGRIILTGAIDEYFDYCYGKLPYRGMQSVHYESEIGLDGDFVTFSDTKIPFQRLVDYKRLGYEGQWIGVESACNATHYPIRDKKSEKLYSKYKDLADKRGIFLCGRLATYHYQDMDSVIADAMELARRLNG